MARAKAAAPKTNELLSRCAIDPSSFEPGINKGTKSHTRNRSGLPGRNIAIEMQNYTLRQVIGFNFSLNSEPANFWNETPMATDNSF